MNSDCPLGVLSVHGDSLVPEIASAWDGFDRSEPGFTDFGLVVFGLVVFGVADSNFAGVGFVVFGFVAVVFLAIALVPYGILNLFGDQKQIQQTCGSAVEENYSNGWNDWIANKFRVEEVAFFALTGGQKGLIRCGLPI